jgi:aryl-alcohol dehydrogenase-like predicted oxidoreductase
MRAAAKTALDSGASLAALLRHPDGTAPRSGTEKESQLRAEVLAAVHRLPLTHFPKLIREVNRSLCEALLVEEDGQ